MDKHSTLTKILRLRQLKKEEIELEIKNINKFIEIARSMLESLEREFIESAEDFERKQKMGGIRSNEMDLFYNYFMYLNDEINSRRNEMNARISELNRLKVELLESYRDEKVFEKLKDKIEAEELKGRLADEQKEMDFLFLLKGHQNGR